MDLTTLVVVGVPHKAAAHHECYAPYMFAPVDAFNFY